MPVMYYDADEWYPVVIPVTEESCWPDNTADFTNEENLRITKAFEEFRSVQKLICEKFKVSKGNWV